MLAVLTLNMPALAASQPHGILVALCAGGGERQVMIPLENEPSPEAPAEGRDELAGCMHAIRARGLAAEEAED